MAFFEPGYFQDAREGFAAQFNQETGSIVYRKNGVGEGFIVSVKEREKFIEDYNKFLSRQRWYMFIIVPFLFLTIVPFSLALDLDQSGFGILFVIYLSGLTAWAIRSNYSAFAAPATALANRQTSGPNVTQSQARRDWLKKRDWSTFVLGPAAALLISYKMDVFEAPFALDRIFWTIMSIGILLLFAVQAVRKWTIEKEDRVKDR